MKYKQFESYCKEGDVALLSVIRFNEKLQISRKNFFKFIKENGFSSWHIKDGWVTHKGVSQKALENEDIEITWIDLHTGFSHHYKCPEIGEKICIIKESPGSIDETKPFDMYCYYVVDKKLDTYFYDIYLKLINIEKVMLNPIDSNYMFYRRKKSFWDLSLTKAMRQLLLKLNRK